MINAFFRPSDKIRDLLRNALLYSALTIFFSIYKIPITGIPFINLSTNQDVASMILKDVEITNILILVAAFYFTNGTILFLTEFIDWRRAAELRLADEAINGLFPEKLSEIKMSREGQRLYDSAQKALRRLYTGNVLLGYFRFVFEFVIPAAFLIIALFRSGGALLRFLRLSLR